MGDPIRIPRIPQIHIFHFTVVNRGIRSDPFSRNLVFPLTLQGIRSVHHKPRPCGFARCVFGPRAMSPRRDRGEFCLYIISTFFLSEADVCSLAHSIKFRGDASKMVSILGPMRGSSKIWSRVRPVFFTTLPRPTILLLGSMRGATSPSGVAWW